MKKLYTIIGVWFVITTSYAQQFTQLGTDPQNDYICVCPDLKSFSVAIDKDQDSVWFKIETHSPRGATYGYYVELDWDKNGSNGSTWTGGGGFGTCGGPSNYQVMRDRTIIMWHNYKHFEQWNGSGGSGVPGGVINVQYPDAKTIIINSKLSQVDKDADGDFNVFASVGVMAYAMLDQMPNAGGFYNTQGITQSVKELAAKYPDVYVKQGQLVVRNAREKNMQVQLFDVRGKKVLSKQVNENGLVDVYGSTLPSGIYIYRLVDADQQTISTGKIGLL